MHELSVALQICETLETDLRDDNALLATDDCIGVVRLRVGQLTGIVPEALEFAWESAIRGTAFHNAALRIETVEATARCANCEQDRKPVSTNQFQCNVCNTDLGEAVLGKELEILSVDLVDAA